MKRLHTLIFAFLLALPFGATAQGIDSAALVVDGYLRLLNVESVPHDSCLYLRTEITMTSHGDTLVMERWFARDGMARVEVRFGDSLMTGLCTNGRDRYRHYIPAARWWDDIDTAQFRSRLEGYDYRGPLHNWRGNGCRLTWQGPATVGGHPLLAVLVQRPEWFDRVYFFDPSNRLLTFVIEHATMNGEAPTHLKGEYHHIDWKAFHEYQPVGSLLLPSLESFMRQGVRTVMRTEVRLLPLDPFEFNHD